MICSWQWLGRRLSQLSYLPVTNRLSFSSVAIKSKSLIICFVNNGEQCYGPPPLCVPNKEYPQIVEGSRWCGVDFSSMSSKCQTECLNGTYDECDKCGKCFNRCLCQFEHAGWPVSVFVWTIPQTFSRELTRALWKFRWWWVWRGMSCFNVQFDEESCLTEGVGIKESTDPSNLWCDSSWFQLLEK